PFDPRRPVDPLPAQPDHQRSERAPKKLRLRQSGLCGLRLFLERVLRLLRRTRQAVPLWEKWHSRTKREQAKNFALGALHHSAPSAPHGPLYYRGAVSDFEKHF